MTIDDDSAGVEHLLSRPIRGTMDGEGYGAWRSFTDPDAVPLSFGFPFPDSFPLEDLSEAVETLFTADPDTALQYTGPGYATSLPEIIAGRARERGIDCTSDQVHLTNGATHAIDTVCQAFLDPGDLVVVERPTFMGALRLLRNYAVDIEGIDVDADGLDVDALATTLAERRAAGEALPKLCYTIPNFQNPTGATLAAERRERLVELAVEYDFVVLEDDPYGRLRYDGEEPPSLRTFDPDGRVIRVDTFSKTIAPGVRTGWIIADEPVIEQLRRVDAGGENRFTRGVIAAYCEDGRLETAIEGLCAAYEPRRDRMLAALSEHMPPGTTWSEPSGGFFVWVTFPEGIDTEAMIDDAIAEGVTYLPGSSFYSGDRGRRHARLSFSEADPDAIERGIAALSRAVRAAMDPVEAGE
ncbi:aminotransferase-like domain-containing protein [Halorubrum vacuolatum]|uniref:2-aminoadipate transaminase n=1 Tax=Halorubrum vacuolatum TaxID=63740 RepID=A0A238VL20_HALVU|nr:PLP-dependent aminotransferase family protein [Halorubrum vacuolatum]SNR34881.1 2-aminoadipate transaminase [Halorubrum vacuolatum]